MSAYLIAVSHPVSGESPQDLIAYCARVSNPANQENYDTAEKLLTYCIRNKHWSPFEMVSVTFEINTTRDIARQILRHRSFSFQEFSQRYADPSQLGFTVREARLQDTKNRQNSIETSDEELKKTWNAKQEQIIHECKLAYKWALENGVAKEQARSVLPEGCTNSRLYMSGTLRSWIHYCQLRTANGTQKEHIEVAKEIWEILVVEFPFLASIEKVTLSELLASHIATELEIEARQTEITPVTDTFTRRYNLVDKFLSMKRKK